MYGLPRASDCGKVVEMVRISRTKKGLKAFVVGWLECRRKTYSSNAGNSELTMDLLI